MRRIRRSSGACTHGWGSSRSTGAGTRIVDRARYSSARARRNATVRPCTHMHALPARARVLRIVQELPIVARRTSYDTILFTDIIIKDCIRKLKLLSRVHIPCTRTVHARRPRGANGELAAALLAHRHRRCKACTVPRSELGHAAPHATPPRARLGQSVPRRIAIAGSGTVPRSFFLQDGVQCDDEGVIREQRAHAGVDKGVEEQDEYLRERAGREVSREEGRASRVLACSVTPPPPTPPRSSPESRRKRAAR